MIYVKRGKIGGRGWKTSASGKKNAERRHGKPPTVSAAGLFKKPKAIVPEPR
jgi:hypothetical protein